MGAGEVGWDNGSDTTQIVADKKSYAPGDTAHLSIVSETGGFYALVIAQGYTVQKREVMHSDGKTLSFDLPITADSQPNITVDALFIKDNTLYQATKTLKVPPVQQQLQVEITPTKDVFQPQQSATYDVVTRDFTGKPVSRRPELRRGGRSDLLALSGLQRRHGESLYPQRYVESQVDSSLEYYFSGEAGTKSPLLALRNARYHPQLAQVKPGNEAKPRVRKAFPDTAFWAPDRAHRRQRPRARLAHFPGFPHDLARDGSRHHAGLQGGFRHQPRAGAQECAGAHGHAALHAERRRDHACP